MKNLQTDESYNKYVESITPKHSCVNNCINAFLIGGAICTLGQFICNIIEQHFGYELSDAQSFTSILLVLFSVILTSLNLYKKIAKYGGAGALVPITGFANSVCAPAVEYQTEGEVYGKGVKVFTIAGPVILFGIVTSFVAGLIYYLLLVFEVL